MMRTVHRLCSVFRNSAIVIIPMFAVKMEIKEANVVVLLFYKKEIPVALTRHKEPVAAQRNYYLTINVAQIKRKVFLAIKIKQEYF